MAALREPKSILDHPTLTATLDLSQPVAVMLVAVLMYFRDTDNPNPSRWWPRSWSRPQETAKAVAAAEAAG
jgi:hypothetical protein